MLHVECSNVLENKRPQCLSGCSGYDLIREDCYSGKSSLSLTYRVLIGRMGRPGTGRTILSKAKPTPMVAPRWVVVDEKQIGTTKKKWLDAAIDIEVKLLQVRSGITVRISRCRRSHRHRGKAVAGDRCVQPLGKDPARRPSSPHQETRYLRDGVSRQWRKLPAILARRELNGQLNYNDRNHIEKWLQIVTIRIDPSHSVWQGSPASTKR